MCIGAKKGNTRDTPAPPLCSCAQTRKAKRCPKISKSSKGAGSAPHTKAAQPTRHVHQKRKGVGELKKGW